MERNILRAIELLRRGVSKDDILAVLNAANTNQWYALHPEDWNTVMRRAKRLARRAEAVAAAVPIAHRASLLPSDSARRPPRSRIPFDRSTFQPSSSLPGSNPISNRPSILPNNSARRPLRFTRIPADRLRGSSSSRPNSGHTTGPSLSRAGPPSVASRAPAPRTEGLAGQTLYDCYDPRGDGNCFYTSTAIGLANEPLTQEERDRRAWDLRMAGLDYIDANPWMLDLAREQQAVFRNLPENEATRWNQNMLEDPREAFMDPSRWAGDFQIASVAKAIRCRFHILTYEPGVFRTIVSARTPFSMDNLEALTLMPPYYVNGVPGDYDRTVVLLNMNRLHFGVAIRHDMAIGRREDPNNMNQNRALAEALQFQ